jgi:hypothetical protein
MKTTVRNALRRALSYALTFALGALCATAFLLSSHAIRIGVSAMNVGERIALAGGAQSGLLTREEVQAIVAETMATYARRESAPLKIVRR